MQPCVFYSIILWYCWFFWHMVYSFHMWIPCCTIGCFSRFYDATVCYLFILQSLLFFDTLVWL